MSKEHIDQETIEDEPSTANNTVEEPPAKREVPEGISYHDYLAQGNPNLTEEEIQEIIKKENRSAWIVRFQLLALIIFAIIIIYFIVAD